MNDYENALSEQKAYNLSQVFYKTLPLKKVFYTKTDDYFQ